LAHANKIFDTSQSNHGLSQEVIRNESLVFAGDGTGDIQVIYSGLI